MPPNRFGGRLGETTTREKSIATERANERREETMHAGSSLEDLIDLEFEAFCAHEGDESITLDEVWKATASIPGSMAEAIIEERADRF